MAEIEIFKSPADVDWDHLLELLHSTFAYMDERINPPSSLHRMDADQLRSKATSETLFLAMKKKQLVGCMFCRVEPDFIYVGKVAVSTNAQGQGIGRKMFQEAFELARLLGRPALELETRIELVENHRAFSKMGFVKIGEDAHEGFDSPTGIRMRAQVSL